MNNQECKARPKIINVNNDEPVFYPYSIKVFNLMSRINETRQMTKTNVDVNVKKN